MKRGSFIVLIFFCLASNAQLYVGAKGGVNMPDLAGTHLQKGYTSHTGINPYGGVLAGFQFSNRLSFQTEANFSIQGGKWRGIQPVPTGAITALTIPEGEILYANYDVNTILNYIEIPFLAKITLGKKLKYYASIGPYISVLMRAKKITTGNSLLYTDAAGSIPFMIKDSVAPPIFLNSTTLITEKINTINAGLQGGAGIQYPVCSGNIFLEYRAILGLTNINSRNYSAGKSETNSLVIAAGYFFKLK